MGGKGPNSSSSSSTTVCCMCGDHGLSQELFRCKVCHFRSQHKYCSDLYLKAESYRACNWCLREDGGKSLARESVVNNDNTTTNNNAISPSSSNGGTRVKLHRASFPSYLNKPIKKQRVPQRSVSDVNERMMSEELSPRLGRTRQACRGKVRRYKLLEEVSSLLKIVSYKQ